MSKKLIWALAIIMTGTVVWMIIIQASWFKTSFELRQEQFSEQVMKTLNDVVKQLDEREVMMHISNDIIALSFDSIPPFGNTPRPQTSDTAGGASSQRPDLVGRILADSNRSSTLMVRNNDSLFYQILGRGHDGRIKFDQNSMNREQFQNEVSKRVKIDKTVFVEKVVNQIIRKKVNLEDRISPKELLQMLTKAFGENGIYSSFQFAVLKEDGGKFFSTDDYEVDRSDVNYYPIELFPSDILWPKSTLKVYFPDEAKISRRSLNRQMFTSIVLVVIIMTIFLVTILIIYRQKRLHEMKTDFINNMTHELKTPIASISLASQMLKDPMVSKNDQSFNNLSSVIEEECKRLGSHVERVLQMATLERGQTTLKIKDVYVNDIIRRVVKSVELKLKDRGGLITCKYAAKDDLVEADEVHITNIINNLLDNAIKYTEKQPELRITTENVKDGVQISIADNGIGISRDDQRHIFEQFFRVHTGNVHNVKGFGIGLSYVKRTVEAHNGSIKVKSEMGKGSTFIIFLPFSH